MQRVASYGGCFTPTTPDACCTWSDRIHTTNEFFGSRTETMSLGGPWYGCFGAQPSATAAFTQPTYDDDAIVKAP